MEPLGRYEPIVDDYESFEAACRRPLPVAVRVNTIKTDVRRAKRSLEEEGIAWEPRAWNETVLVVDTDSPGNTWGHFHGWIHGQEEISALPATILAPEPGERVWDACAAPGGKTAQMAALMADEGIVVANDDNLGRLSALRFNAERLGLTNVAVTNRDARNFSMKPFGFETFDRVLVDAPCSCEGTVRKNPRALDDWSIEHVRSVAGIQKGILRRAVQVTEPGGTVVYATCTFAPEENEAVVDHVLAHEACRVVPVDSPLDHSPGLTRWDPPDGSAMTFDEQIRHACRYYPHQNDTGGFFCAKLEVPT